MYARPFWIDVSSISKICILPVRGPTFLLDLQLETQRAI